MTCVPVHLRQSLIQVSPNDDIQEISRELEDSLRTWEMQNQTKKEKDQIQVTSFDYVIIGNGFQSKDYSHCMPELFTPVDLSDKESQDMTDPDPASTSNSTDDPDPADTSLLVEESADNTDHDPVDKPSGKTDPDHTSPSKHTKPTSKPDHDPAASPFKSTQQSESTSAAKKDQVNEGQGMDAVGEVSHHVRMDELRTLDAVSAGNIADESAGNTDHISASTSKPTFVSNEIESKSGVSTKTKKATKQKSSKPLDVFSDSIFDKQLHTLITRDHDPTCYPLNSRHEVRKGQLILLILYSIAPKH